MLIRPDLSKVRDPERRARLLVLCERYVARKIGLQVSTGSEAPDDLLEVQRFLTAQLSDRSSLIEIERLTRLLDEAERSGHSAFLPKPHFRVRDPGILSAAAETTSEGANWKVEIPAVDPEWQTPAPNPEREEPEKLPPPPPAQGIDGGFIY